MFQTAIVNIFQNCISDDVDIVVCFCVCAFYYCFLMVFFFLSFAIKEKQQTRSEKQTYISTVHILLLLLSKYIMSYVFYLQLCM